MKNKSNIISFSQIKAIFFDLYGTLLVFNNFDKANTDWVNAYYNIIKKEKEIDLTAVEKICKDILESDIKKDSINELTTYETKIKHGFESIGISLPKEKLKKIANDTVGTWQQYVKLADDALNVLGKLKENKRLALITNFDHSPHIRKLLKETGLENLFEKIIISDEANCKKPQPEIFRLALSEMNLHPEEVIYVGDSIQDDIQGALSAGIKPILISRNSKSNYTDHELTSSKNENPSEFQTINSLSELVSFFQ